MRGKKDDRDNQKTDGEGCAQLTHGGDPPEGRIKTI
jgi:hypothetical protein